MKVRSVQFCISCCVVHWNAAHFCCTAVHCVVQWNAHSSRVQQRDGGASLANMVKNYMSTGFFGHGQASSQIYFQITLAACICPICKMYIFVQMSNCSCLNCDLNVHLIQFCMENQAADKIPHHKKLRQLRTTRATIMSDHTQLDSFLFCLLFKF